MGGQHASKAAPDQGKGPKRTIRRQLTRIVLIPSISFLALWAVITATGTVQAGAALLTVKEGGRGLDALTDVAAELRKERRLSQVHLAGLDEDAAVSVLARLRGQRAETDRALKSAAKSAEGLYDHGEGELDRRVDSLLGDRAELAALRTGVDEQDSAGPADRAAVLDGYTAVISDALLVAEAVVVQLDDDRSLAAGVLALDLMGALDQYSQADALLAGALTAGEMTYEETARFTYLSASYRDTLTRAERNLGPAERASFKEMLGDASWVRTEQFSRRVVTRAPVVADPPGATTGDGAAFNTEIPVSGTDWDNAVRDAAPAFDALVAAQTDTAISEATSAALWRIGTNLSGCLIALAAGGVAIVVALRSSRRVTERLRGLRGDTLELSATRLPELVAAAQSGRRVDVAKELPPLSHGDDEIGQVADAFNTAQRTAVGAAVKQAEIREGATRVFLGIAYRNQALVQRQLRLLDEIEFAEEDAPALQRLFRLDHLITRGRRYADNLIILGGAGSARRWREPRSLVEVLRAAISETEDYERVRLTSAPKLHIQGFAVADVVHLVAELVENATQFSPAGSPVDVNSGAVPGGLAVDVEDRGLGMTEETMDAANRTLADPPEFDVMALPEEPRLGLFVVARLAARHGVKVRLSPSPYGGTRATALLPQRLLEDAPGPDESQLAPVTLLSTKTGRGTADPRGLDGQGGRGRGKADD
ncbi:signal transduction histidine kinase [Murinocardiopsis flavida]|uniref:histidine kinase n=1 Tax=Murinocardiopsis flavida TaxID=645275 RepID=A0A2P8DK84_9ACTN|nr:nitrate- and nitrite sensing domain-containing protein [Murinocardiopsis flavida]PSK97619.1 signal transduction histidine kinase [Murinocardiopsis flavida]